MIQFHCYHGGKKRVVTFSYDDGHKNDERLVALFNRYGVKGTFHINGADFSDLLSEKAYNAVKAVLSERAERLKNPL